ncbi:acyltransferase family protein [Bradyrhizobium sp. USDA 4454]
MATNGTIAATDRSLDRSLDQSPGNAAARVDWVDYAKGICIIMVVMMHSVLGVEKAAGQIGFMHYVVMFAKPFRMPDFFMISGLFLSVVIGRDWRTYLDRKVMHFAYFYVLWVTIQFGFKAPSLAAEAGWAEIGRQYLTAFVQPFGTLWFIYLLPIFFVVTKLTRNVHPLAIWLIAAALESAHIATGWYVIDEFSARFVYFLTGYVLADYVFALSDRARSRPTLALLGLGLWALVNGGLVACGVSEWPVVSLALGFAGACAIIVTGTLLARAHWLGLLRYCGEHSIVIYLAFFLPMAATRTLLLRFDVIPDIGLISLIVTVAGVAGSLLIWRLALAVRANFLFERPDAFWIVPKKAAPALQAAE